MKQRCHELKLERQRAILTVKMNWAQKTSVSCDTVASSSFESQVFCVWASPHTHTSHPSMLCFYSSRVVWATSSRTDWLGWEGGWWWIHSFHPVHLALHRFLHKTSHDSRDLASCIVHRSVASQVLQRCVPVLLPWVVNESDLFCAWKTRPLSSPYIVDQHVLQVTFFPYFAYIHLFSWCEELLSVITAVRSPY